MCSRQKFPLVILESLGKKCSVLGLVTVDQVSGSVGAVDFSVNGYPLVPCSTELHLGAAIAVS